MDFKKTLNMPQTSFEMKANLIEKESKYREKWYQDNIYQRILEEYKDNISFILHDGPPYANGDLHVGHALNKILKDIIVRWKTLNKYYSPFVPGWDTHGLPIEHKMLSESNLKKEEISPLELRIKAKAYALEQVEIQKEQFKQLQLFSDFKKYYITLDKKYVAKQLEVFSKMILDGLVYKGLKPIYWSPTSQSALAEAEVEYKEVRSPSLYLKLRVVSSNFEKIHNGDDIVVWTTTPWTLLANSGAAVGLKIKYIRVKVENDTLIFSEELFKKYAEKNEIYEYDILDEFYGYEVLGKNILYFTPITRLLAPLVVGHHVTEESGTGIVHIAPMFGEDDFLIGQRFNLEKIMHVADDGTIFGTGTDFDGLFYDSANKPIVEFLDDRVMKLEFMKHSYPHDWRTHKPIIYRGTPQWFVSIDKIRRDILENIETKVSTYPEWAKTRLRNMIAERGDWTISRQRTWGVPIIIFYDEHKNPVIDKEQFDFTINQVLEHDINIWWEWDTQDLLHPKYKGREFTREMDIMDVWFDSGVSFTAVDIDERHKAPYDLYLEGIDQYRGWFNSSIINSVAYQKTAPYKQIVSHGFVLDKNGNKMSKSLGNVIKPIDVVKKRGADILRLWAANSEYTNDVNISDDILDQNTEIYRKIRNTIRFMLGNLSGFEYDSNIQKTGVHALISEQLNELKLNIKKAYDEYKFINVVKLLNNYIVDLSGFYLSITKDILYIRKSNDPERLMVQSNLYEIVDFIIKAIAPILPTTAEEAYEHFNKATKYDSIMFDAFDFNNVAVNKSLIEQFDEFFQLRAEVNAKVDNLIKEGTIKRINEVYVKLPNSLSDFIKSLDLKTLLMVGKVSFESNNELEIATFDSEKCQRCWNHFEKSEMIDNLCNTCYEIVKDWEDK
ncbi:MULTISPECIES: isoleucine--tRNA ligase [unclassified Mycoplasma]|uniref:isoleucine--tRNA ligase n=1 Tax=unclassified Mycoplasma TaxID=2683645 RepID=UPI002B1E03A2|nr:MULTISPECIES: isoleucine--tRNA ligase [unclassified Mycoplasma]MEA4191292.1 isoleucine--tRNA ligase [Mycoplasma sp. 2248]MEA4206440.1 isoleucine--tRNA ligase [Mycoplasma sp. 1199]